VSECGGGGVSVVGGVSVCVCGQRGQDGEE
jgi:hypothetical protein